MFSRFFIDRPIFAAVLSIVICLGGFVARMQLPIAQYPRIAPPSIVVMANYPGASARDVAESIAAPIEQQVNGVEDMIYMSSQSANDGSYQLNVTFRPGVNLDFAQVLVQNRVNLALPLLPDVVKQTGLTTRKRNPDILLVVSMYSPHRTKDPLYLSNYCTIQIADELKRLDGVGDVFLFGQQDYSMRVWVDPDRLSAKNLTAGDVVNAVHEQNFQFAAGRVGQPPAANQTLDTPLAVKGRLSEPEEFDDIVVTTGAQGQIVRVKDVGHTTLGARSQDVTSKVDGHPCTSIAVFQLPYANALDCADGVRAKMEDLKKSFPDDVEYTIAFDTTPFVRDSIHEVFVTLAEAIALVAIVVLLFLQNWRSTLIPLTAVPVALLGTFAVMQIIGFSMNTLTLFGLVLAIGIVVDDAIVVVEAVEHHIEHGLSPRAAAYKAMEQVSAPVIAVALVLSFVFVPCAFLTGITGQFFRQFAVAIAASTIISAFNSLTLSPALAALLLQPRGARKDFFGRFLDFTLGWFFRLFERSFKGATSVYLRMVKLALRGSVIVVVIYVGLMVLTGWGFSHLPSGYIPDQDQARLFAAVQLPDAASKERSQQVVDVVERVFHRTPGCDHTISLTGMSFTLGANGSNFGNMFVTLKENSERRGPALTANAIAANLDKRLKSLHHLSDQSMSKLRELGLAEATLAKVESVRQEEGLDGEQVEFVETKEEFAARLKENGLEQYEEDILSALQVYDLNAQVGIFPPAPINGLGTAGGFKLIVEDRSGEGDLPKLQRETDRLVASIRPQDPDKPPPPAAAKIARMFTVFRANAPQQYADINRAQAQTMGVNPGDVFTALQVYLGSLYVVDFNKFGRTWQVIVQAEGDFRNQPEKVGRLKVRNAGGNMVPLNEVVNIEPKPGPLLIMRYNMYPSAAVMGSTATDISSGEGIDAMQDLCDQTLSPGFGHEWTEINWIQIDSDKNLGNRLIFPLAVVFVFLVLAAQYESWALPLAVILVVPMCILGSLVGVYVTHSDINIFTQIGFVVLVGLASKNAILIVEFAKHMREEGLPRHEAVLAACQLRLRPILMTSFAFILGVVPLMLAEGAGAEMRRVLGTAVFSGMVAVTVFGIFLTPVFFNVIEWFVEAPLSPRLRSHYGQMNPDLRLALGHGVGILMFTLLVCATAAVWLMYLPLMSDERDWAMHHLLLFVSLLLTMPAIVWILVTLLGWLTRRRRRLRLAPSVIKSLMKTQAPPDVEGNGHLGNGDILVKEEQQRKVQRP
jgi:multidrug efflux pump